MREVFVIKIQFGSGNLIIKAVSAAIVIYSVYSGLRDCQVTYAGVHKFSKTYYEHQDFLASLAGETADEEIGGDAQQDTGAEGNDADAQRHLHCGVHHGG